ncbi:MAG: hypothetical protein NZ761_06870 [Dehalococcoidia bacterium]|nr:hypothetical protein [Dehalococcoidia bacterium]
MPRVVCSRGVEVDQEAVPGKLEIASERHRGWGGGWAAVLEGRDPTAPGGVRRSFLEPRERSLSRAGHGTVTFEVSLREGTVVEVEYVRRAYECARAYFAVEGGTVKQLSRDEALARLPELHPRRVLPLRVRVEVHVRARSQPPLRDQAHVSVEFVGRGAMPPQSWRERLQQAGYQYRVGVWHRALPLEEALVEAASLATELLDGEPRPQSVELAVEEMTSGRWERWYEVREADDVPSPTDLYRALGFDPDAPTGETAAEGEPEAALTERA